MNTAGPPDARLVADLESGDPDALGVLYQRYGRAVRTFLRRVEPQLSDEDAADLCQETFLTFHSTVARYREQGKLRSWLFGIAVRKARSHRRRQWWRRTLRAGEGANAAGVSLYAPETDARVHARMQIDRVMRLLPAAQREVLVLHVVEGLSVQETAEALGIRENAVSTRLYRARRALAEAR